VIKDEAYKIPVTVEQTDDEPEEIYNPGELYDESGDTERETDGGTRAATITKDEKAAQEELKELKELRELKERQQKEKEAKEQADILSEREAALERERIKNEMIAQAQTQTQRTADLIISHTLENAKTELNAVISQGYADGFETGRNEAAAVIAPALEKISLLADAITKMQDEMLEDFKDEMFDIIAEISQKILKKEIDEKDEYLLTLFEEAIKDIKAESFVTVTVSESQSEFALRNIDLFKAKVANIEDFKIIADKNAARGTMVVETAKTVADASFAVQMDEINAVLERMKENISAAGNVLQDYGFEGIMPENFENFG
jgi:flagellar assembly protein FliH